MNTGISILSFCEIFFIFIEDKIQCILLQIFIYRYTDRMQHCLHPGIFINFLKPFPREYAEAYHIFIEAKIAITRQLQLVANNKRNRNSTPCYLEDNQYRILQLERRRAYPKVTKKPTTRPMLATFEDQQLLLNPPC
jgi:hypothetical protein